MSELVVPLLRTSLDTYVQFQQYGEITHSHLDYIGVSSSLLCLSVNIVPVLQEFNG